MDVQEIGPGLWRWTAPHPEWTPGTEWPELVGSLYWEAPDAVVLVDPLVPTDEPDRDRFWRALDRDVEHAGRPVHVLVTLFWHTRSSGEVVERYGARLWAPRGGRAPIERRAGTVTDVYRPGDELPGGVVAYPAPRRTEVLFWIPAHGAVVPGDTLLGDGAGGVRLCPESWSSAGRGHHHLRETLRPLLELPIERILVSHGDPVFTNGREALARALAPA